MARETYSANGVIYTVASDRDIPIGGLPQAVISIVLVDELTALAPAGAIHIDTPLTGLTARTGLGGLAGFAAIPVRAFSRLGLQAYEVLVEIRAEGYLDVSRIVPVDKADGFPDAFKRADTVTISLHRRPVTIYGRAVVASSAGITPAAGAALRMTGLWRTLPAANAIVPPEPPNIVSLSPPLYIDRSAAGTQLAGLDFSGAAGPDKRLLAGAAAGHSQLSLSDCLALGVANVLAIDTEYPELTEFIEVQSIAKSGGDNVPATITLAYPLRFAHRRNAVAHKVAFQAAGPPTSLAQDAIAGDVCAFPAVPGDLGTAPIVQVQGGANPIEYHQVSRFAVTCDAQGFFRLPPLSRVAQCILRAHDGAHADIDLTVCPDYSPGETRVDFVFQ